MNAKQLIQWLSVTGLLPRFTQAIDQVASSNSEPLPKMTYTTEEILSMIKAAFEGDGGDGGDSNTLTLVFIGVDQADGYNLAQIVKTPKDEPFILPTSSELLGVSIGGSWISEENYWKFGSQIFPETDMILWAG